MTCCYCECCMSDWWRHKDLCKHRFDFDSTLCSHFDNAMNKCQKKTCPTVDSKCSRLKVLTLPRVWETKTAIRKSKTSDSSEIYYDEFPIKRKLSDVINYLLTDEVRNRIDNINVSYRDSICQL